MKTAIIVLNYNDYENTRQYLDRIKEYQILDKIVVVDNCSQDNSFQKLKNYENDKIDVIQSNKNGGYSYGNNFGIRYLENNHNEYYETIIISNPDIEVTEDTIQKCIEVLHSKQKIAVVAPRMYLTNGKPARRSCWKERTFWIDVANSTRLTEFLLYPLFRSGEYNSHELEQDFLEVHAIAGSFFLVKHNILKEINYFDENTFLFFEEDILAKKLEQKGYETISLNNLKFIHHESVTIGKLYNKIRKIELINKSKKYYHKTYHNIGKLNLKIFDILLCIRKFELWICQKI